MKIRDTIFYKVVKPLVIFLVAIIFHPKVEGKENIPKKGRILFAGNHTEWADPVIIVATQRRQVHFLAKEELFHGVMGIICRGMGCVSVNRKIHDKEALYNAYKFLEKELCVGIFPEATINRTEKIILPFKIGAVKAAQVTNTKIVPFVITGKYNFIGKRVKIQYFPPITIGDNLDKENKKLENFIIKKIREEEKKNG